MTLPVGIDDLNLYGSTLAVSSTAIATARGFSPRELQGAGFDRRTVLPPYEDPVTLGANAALPLVEAAGRDRFELLIVATESGFDYGKPLSTYVHEHLRLPRRCRNLEVKHACYGGTAAIQLAAAWVRSGEAPGKKALVVMTDQARRHFDDPAELTAGSGAVAVTVAAEPSVLEIERCCGVSCREIYDVARPSATGEWGDALLSVAAYLDLIEEAWADYRCSAGTMEAIDRRFAYLLYHTPLVSLAREAHRLLLESEAADRDMEEVLASFDRMVTPALGFARELANVYSGSVYCLLAGLLDGEAKLPAGTRIGICSYGSGSCAEVYGGITTEASRATVRGRSIGAHLGERVPLEVGLYEQLVRESEMVLTSASYQPERDFVPGHYERSYAGRERLVLVGIENHHRRYAWASDPTAWD